MKIEIAEEDLTQLAQLTELTPNQVNELLHAIWRVGFYEGKIDTARKLQALIGQTASHIFLSDRDDDMARRLKEVYSQAQKTVDAHKKERDEVRQPENEANTRVRAVFRLVRKFIVEWERS